MKKHTNETEGRILVALKKSDFGLTIEQVSQEIGMNRITVSKYLAVMEVKGMLSCRIIGRAKLYSRK